MIHKKNGGKQCSHCEIALSQDLWRRYDITSHGRADCIPSVTTLLAPQMHFLLCVSLFEHGIVCFIGCELDKILFFGVNVGFDFYNNNCVEAALRLRTSWAFSGLVSRGRSKIAMHSEPGSARTWIHVSELVPRKHSKCSTRVCDLPDLWGTSLCRIMGFPFDLNLLHAMRLVVQWLSLIFLYTISGHFSLFAHIHTHEGSL